MKTKPNISGISAYNKIKDACSWVFCRPTQSPVMEGKENLEKVFPNH